MQWFSWQCWQKSLQQSWQQSLQGGCCRGNNITNMQCFSCQCWQQSLQQCYVDNNPSKVVVVVAGQDVLPHYTTLCLFCLKVLEEEEKLKESALVLCSSFSDKLTKLIKLSYRKCSSFCDQLIKLCNKAAHRTCSKKRPEIKSFCLSRPFWTIWCCIGIPLIAVWCHVTKQCDDSTYHHSLTERVLDCKTTNQCQSCL